MPEGEINLVLGHPEEVMYKEYLEPRRYREDVRMLGGYEPGRGKFAGSRRGKTYLQRSKFIDEE